MYRVWVYTVYGWRTVGDYETRDAARAEMAMHKGRAYIVLLGGCMGRMVERNW